MCVVNGQPLHHAPLLVVVEPNIRLVLVKETVMGWLPRESGIVEQKHVCIFNIYTVTKRLKLEIIINRSNL